MTYADSSAVISALLDEPGADAVRSAIARHCPLYSSNLLEAEVRGRLARESVEKDLFEGTLDSLIWVHPNRALRAEYRRSLAAGPLRGADLWHVACALFLSPNPSQINFLTLDKDQDRVARKLGFKVLP